VPKWFGDELKSVGGLPQKIEAFEVGGHTVVAFSRGTGDSVLSGLPCVGPDGLRYVSVVEMLGRQPSELGGVDFFSDQWLPGQDDTPVAR
jgi:hypothetical protein